MTLPAGTILVDTYGNVVKRLDGKVQMSDGVHDKCFCDCDPCVCPSCSGSQPAAKMTYLLPAPLCWNLTFVDFDADNCRWHWQFAGVFDLYLQFCCPSKKWCAWIVDSLVSWGGDDCPCQEQAKDLGVGAVTCVDGVLAGTFAVPDRVGFHGNATVTLNAACP